MKVLSNVEHILRTIFDDEEGLHGVFAPLCERGTTSGDRPIRNDMGRTWSHRIKAWRRMRDRVYAMTS
jgi:hypothetical protein